MSEARPTWQVVTGDAAAALRAMPARSVQCCVTSPPYWGLRDYGHAGQIGNEPTPEAYVAALVSVFAEVWRVLKDDGTLWLNLGDSYTSGGCDTYGTWAPDSKQATHTAIKSARRAEQPPGLKPKDLVGIPWRVAFALQAAGWYLRSDIIWAKPNQMPESVTDRPTKAHEYLFLLAKAERYYYDAAAIRESSDRPEMIGRRNGSYNSRDKGLAPGQGQPHGNFGQPVIYPGERNKRSVWTIATQPYPEAHFATFPESLVEPCVKAGSSERGECPACGKAWERVTDRVNTSCRPTPYDAGRPDGMTLRGTQFVGGSISTKGWEQSCACAPGEPVPQTILDPFAGSGTAGVVAVRLGRSFVGVELNPAYVTLAECRLGSAAPLFTTRADSGEVRRTLAPEQRGLEFSRREA